MSNFEIGQRVYHRSFGYGEILEIEEVVTPETIFTPEIKEYFVITKLEAGGYIVRSQLAEGGATQDLFSSSQEAVPYIR